MAAKVSWPGRQGMLVRRLLALGVVVLGLGMAAGLRLSAAAATEAPVFEHVGNLPRAGGGYYAIAFSTTTPYAYANNPASLDVLNVQVPEKPVRVASVPLPVSNWEDHELGERPDGTKFVVIVARGPSTSGVHVVDVTNPAAPGAPVLVDVPTHTITCINPGCDYAYTSGEPGTPTDPAYFRIIDLRDPAKPRLLADKPASLVGLGHDWDRDAAGIVWHVGETGIAAYDATRPTAPVPLNASVPLVDENLKKYNDAIVSHLHTTMRPFATSFRPNSTGAYENGNVLFVSEEGDNLDCTDGFQTWRVPDLDPVGGAAVQRSLTPLDYWSIEEDTDERPGDGLCSVHWFDFHKRGFVVLPTYSYGTRLLDVRDPNTITQVAATRLPGNVALSSYWVPDRSASGAVTDQPSNLVYTADNVRGLDIFRVALPR